MSSPASILGLSGREVFTILGLRDSTVESGLLQPKSELVVRALKEDGRQTEFKFIAHLDTPVEIYYYRYGSILHIVLRDML